jgi:hypothetical protein
MWRWPDTVRLLAFLAFLLFALLVSRLLSAVCHPSGVDVPADWHAR